MYVNGIETKREGNRFSAEIVLKEKETSIIANAGKHQDRARVILDQNTEPRYSLSFDDNVFFLGDIAKNNHRSIFDNFYLKGLKNLHQKY